METVSGIEYPFDRETTSEGGTHHRHRKAKHNLELGPFAPNGESIVYGSIFHRNKKGITLDIRNEKGKGILKELEKRAPLVGEHNEEIYCRPLNLSLKELQFPKQEGVVKPLRLWALFSLMP